MLLNDVVNTLARRQKGSFTKVCWRKNIESAAARKMGVVVEKETTTVVRFGVEYSHTKRAAKKFCSSFSVNYKVSRNSFTFSSAL